MPFPFGTVPDVDGITGPSCKLSLNAGGRGAHARLLLRCPSPLQEDEQAFLDLYFGANLFRLYVQTRTQRSASAAPRALARHVRRHAHRPSHVPNAVPSSIAGILSTARASRSSRIGRGIIATRPTPRRFKSAGAKMRTTNSGRRFSLRECNPLSWRPKSATTTGLFHGDKTTSYMTIFGAHAGL